ncbi:MAG: TerB family tellurite resistance protein [Azoarcus sp.]|nr:TerB family tellurite resistance protein [Azoarcus sp.]
MSIPLSKQRGIVADLVALILIADGELASRELAALDQHNMADLLGLPRDVLVQAVIDRCRGLLARGDGDGGEAVRVLDLEQVERMLDSVTDPALRIVACRAMLVLSKADGRISTPEQTLLRHALSRWSLSLADLSA